MKHMEMLRAEIDSALHSLAPFSESERLAEAIDYALSSRGKRVRPMLSLLCARCFSEETERVLPVALAIELIHTASLVYDDLPFMDDTATRRGQLSVHKKFGSDIALLCGHSLVSLAFRLIAESELDDRTCRLTVADLSETIGPNGMAAGQAEDLLGKERHPGGALRAAAKKTGVLFGSAAYCGALAGGAKDINAKCLREFGLHLGLAFQIADDFMDQYQKSGEPLNTVHTMGSEHGRVTLNAQLEIARNQIASIPRNEMLLALIDRVGGYA